MLVISLLALSRAQALNTGPEVQTGTVSGKVMDSSYAPVKDASVKLDLGSGSKMTASTDSKGYYMISAVPIGSGYSISVSKDGYKSGTASGVNVSSKKNTTANITMKKK